ncbi:MAG: NADH-quinone oxidoreductase subunit NuoE [Candidatus Coatesbacteria bacterium]
MKKRGGERRKPDERLVAIFARHRGVRSELIPLLQEVQGELGYLSPDSMREVARFLRMPESVIFGVATFYAQFYLTKQGRHKIKVCQGTACHVRGGAAILQAITRKLGIEAGQTAEDGEFSLERVACVGSCALAPVVVTDDKVHGAMTPAKTERLVDSLRKPGSHPK